MTTTISTTVSHPRDDYFVVESPYEVARWRPLVQWVLFIPHGIILHAFRGLASTVGFIYWVVLLVTGKLHRGLFGLMVMHERYSARSTSYLVGFSEDFPPFDFHGGGADNDAYSPVTLNLPEPPEEASRMMALNVLKAIPHYLVLLVFMIGAVLAAVGAWFAVLFTGSWPMGLRRYIVRLNNYYYRVWLYVAMVETGYPKFGLSPA